MADTMARERIQEVELRRNGSYDGALGDLNAFKGANSKRSTSKPITGANSNRQVTNNGGGVPDFADIDVNLRGSLDAGQFGLTNHASMSRTLNKLKQP